MKYIIIDDNPEMRELIREEVCTDRDEIIECSDGDELLVSYSRYQPDFVLTDVKMKKLNGIKATRILKEEYPSARVIVITEDDTAYFKQASLKAGALAFFSKENLFEVKNYINKFKAYYSKKI